MNNKTLVYSTESGRMCPDCGQPKESCACSRVLDVKSGDGIVRISRETKGRKGKGVTLISGLPLNEIELKLLARELKIQCGSGGTVREGIIEIQGDHRDKLMAELKTRGYVAKRIGG
jgi:translation initiation factor 1